jgi:hypothetical protein
VLGFRAWDLRGLLHGAVRPWPGPEYRAGCFGRGGERKDPAVPHTDGSCGSPPCGVYAYRRAEDLLGHLGVPSGGRRYAVGVVALSGKVVEHDRGYRAGRARAVAVAVVGAGVIVYVEGGARLSRLFGAPQRTLAGIVADDPACVDELAALHDLVGHLTDYLEQARLALEVGAGNE